jgi:hypothetical protein
VRPCTWSIRACGRGGIQAREQAGESAALFSNIHQAVHGKKDTKQAVELMQSVMPDEARVKKALKDNVPADTLQRILGLHRSWGRCPSERS